MPGIHDASLARFALKAEARTLALWPHGIRCEQRRFSDKYGWPDGASRIRMLGGHARDVNAAPPYRAR